jgi:hypothetical protein
VTIDEELDLLDQQLRRLKIEYEIFFSNPAKRPPTDIEWKVLSLIRKFSDGSRMKFSQRYRYNEMAQRYAIQSDLWRKKTRIREEGVRRPQDAMLSVKVGSAQEREARFPTAYGVRRKTEGATEAPGAESTAATGAAAAPAMAEAPAPKAFSVECSDATSEREKVASLYKALTEAKQKAGEKAGGSLEAFTDFVNKKTSELRQQRKCDSVVYSVEVKDGKVKLKAKAKN